MLKVNYDVDKKLYVEAKSLGKFMGYVNLLKVDGGYMETEAGPYPPIQAMYYWEEDE